uniref:Uncharacterized protein n=1 Tax=Amphiprion percula TaxID=161767 RepID=A0A3P8SQ86_AMPPE
MASLCKRQQCTIERRGFRQELDSWRHKLIHCVGFESILEGLFGPGLVKDITLFQGKHIYTVLLFMFSPCASSRGVKHAAHGPKLALQRVQYGPWDDFAKCKNYREDINCKL